MQKWMNIAAALSLVFTGIGGAVSAQERKGKSTMKKVFWFMAVAMGLHSGGMAAEIPLWDLAKNDIPPGLKAGTVEKIDGKVRLLDGAAFAVPPEAFPDPMNFTVQVTVSLIDLVENTLLTVMSKQSNDRDDGFTVDANYREIVPGRRIASYVNNIYMSFGQESAFIWRRQAPQVDTPYTFTVAVRDGYASFYLNDHPYQKCYMQMIPNNEPMWIGKSPADRTKPMDVVVREVKVYGPSFRYVSPKEGKGGSTRGAVAGKGWALDMPGVENEEWPKVLIYGDSISHGYRDQLIPELLKQQVYVFHCVHFVGGEVPKEALTEMAGRFKFDAVVFNNGLHSLTWTPETVSDEIVHKRYADLAECFLAGAPEAKIYYLMTTPYTAPRPAPDKPVESLGDKNDVVIRLNRISAQVMQDKKIEVIDIYSILEKRLELAAGDRYHWKGDAYKIISGEIQKRLLPVFGKD